MIVVLELFSADGPSAVIRVGSNISKIHWRLVVDRLMRTLFFFFFFFLMLMVTVFLFLNETGWIVWGLKWAREKVLLGLGGFRMLIWCIFWLLGAGRNDLGWSLGWRKCILCWLLRWNVLCWSLGYWLLGLERHFWLQFLFFWFGRISFELFFLPPPSTNPAVSSPF